MELTSIAVNPVNIAEITNVSRNLGYAWSSRGAGTNTPVPTVPAWKGLGLSGVLRQDEAAGRENGANYWASSVFVDGRRVVGIEFCGEWEHFEVRKLREALAAGLDVVVLLEPEAIN